MSRCYLLVGLAIILIAIAIFTLRPFQSATEAPRQDSPHAIDQWRSRSKGQVFVLPDLKRGTFEERKGSSEHGYSR